MLSPHAPTPQAGYQPDRGFTLLWAKVRTLICLLMLAPQGDWVQPGESWVLELWLES